MAIQLRHDDDGLSETHEINVTPFIDVMLVLLIIFMVTAPLTTVNVPVSLPASTAAPKPPPQQPVFITLQADLSIAVGDKHVGRGDLAAAVEAATKGDRQDQIFLRADKTVDYGHLMEMLDDLRNAGFLKIALVGLEASSGSHVAASE